ncbi:MAG: PQQ-binding-like beta-propeller repeat protein, partial [Planctomycetaceae bacterium]|nr:PQQ-binding-like beta-propeller repeat protein [Planctomycetaceae bacterium]
MTKRLLPGLFLTVVASGVFAPAGEVTYFRGDGGVATTPQALPENFTDGARLVWKQPLPGGHSTPTIVGDRLVLTTFADEQLATVAMNLQTGEPLWRQVCPATQIEPFHQTGSPAACTVASDGQFLYVFFGSYGLLCYDLDGRLQWEKPLGPFQDEFEAASSPVLADGKIILNEDHDVNSFVMALDAATGNVLWRTDRPGFTRSYSTPVIWEVDGRKQVVVAGALSVMAYDLETGSIVWQVRGLSRMVETTPVIADGRLIVATWSPGGDQTERIAMEPFPEALAAYDKDGDGEIGKDELPEGDVRTRFFRIDLNQNGALDAAEWAKQAAIFDMAQNVAIAIRPGGAGDITDTHVDWIHRRGLPTVSSPLAYEGVLYMVKDGGIVTALDTATGELFKQGRSGVSSNYFA